MASTSASPSSLQMSNLQGSSETRLVLQPRTREVSEFLGSINGSPQLWRSVDVRLAAINRDGQWVNVVSHCTLRPQRPDQLRPLTILPHLDKFVALQLIRPIDELPLLIEAIQAGELEVEGVKILFSGRSNSTPVLGYNDSSAQITARMEGAAAIPSFPYGHTLTLRGTSAGSMIPDFHIVQRRLNSQLRSLRHPWVDLAGVIRHGVGSSHHLESTSTLHATFIAPLEAKLDKRSCSLSHGELRYNAVAAHREAYRLSDLKLFGTRRDGGLISQSVAIGEKRWRRDSQGYRLVGMVKVPHAEKITLMMRLGSEDCGEITLHDQTSFPPALLVAAQALNEAEKFEQHLLGPFSNEGKEFERAVSRLFTLCGFLVEPLGTVKKNELPDALAAVPGTNILFVIECTIGPLAKDGKMSRLHRRAVTVAGAMGDTPHAAVIPLMVTPLPMSEISFAEREQAESDGVIIIGNDHLSTLLTLARKRAPVEEAFQQILPQPRWGLDLDRNPLTPAPPPDLSAGVVFADARAKGFRRRRI